MFQEGQRGQNGGTAVSKRGEFKRWGRESRSRKALLDMLELSVHPLRVMGSQWRVLQGVMASSFALQEGHAGYFEECGLQQARVGSGGHLGATAWLGQDSET